MLERMGVGVPGRVGRFRPEQIADRSTWLGPPDASLAGRSTLAALVAVNQHRHKASTVTHVNPLDPIYELGRWGDCADPGPGHPPDCGCPSPAVNASAGRNW